MAYKFQLGAAVLSGSLTQEGNITGEGNLVLANGATLGAANDSDLLTLGNGVLTVAGEVSMTTLDIGGTDVTATAAELNLIDGDTARGTTDVSSGDGFLHNDDGTMRMTSVDKIADLFAGSGLAASSGVLSVNVDGLSALGGTGVEDGDVFLFSDGGTEKKIAFSNLYGAVFGQMQGGQATVNAGGDISLAVSAITSQTEMTGDVADADELMISDGGVLKRLDFSVLRDAVFTDVSGDATVAAGGALTIANDAVEQAMIADDAVGADQLASNAVVNDSVASNAAIALSKINTNVDMGGNFTIGSQADDIATFTGGVTVGGNLTVNGTVTTVNSTTINITSSFTFEGPADDHETVLGVVDPTADSTINLPAMATGTYFLPVLAAASTTAITATPDEINLIDGGTARGTTAVASGDGFLHNDGGTMRMTSVDKIADLFAGNGIAASSAVLRLDINGIAGAKTTLAQADLVGISDSADGNAAKKVTFSNLEDQIFGNVSGDATIAAGGALTIANDAIESGMLNDNIISGQTELAAGGIVDADELLISDGGTLKRVGVDTLRSFVNIGSPPATVADGDTLTNPGVYYMANMTDDGEDTITLPLSSDMEAGMSIKIKAPSDCSSARFVTIATNGGDQKIDGADSIRLESPFAAVELIYVAADQFRVF